MAYKELDIKLQKDINVYLHHALPLCIITADEKLIPWFYEHYIEIFSRTDENEYVFADFLEYWSPYRVICEEIHMGIAFMKEVADIVDYIIEKLDMDYYISISLDEYYLPNKLDFMNKHKVSSSLVYGYNTEKRQFLAIGFDKDHTFSKMTMDFDDFASAYDNLKKYYKESAPWCETEVIEMIKRWDFRASYPFSLSNFLSKLYRYINSEADNTVAFGRLDPKDGDNIKYKYGLGVYDDLISHLEGNRRSDYRFIHLLYESKKSIYDRLVFVAGRYDLKEKLQDSIDQYLGVVKKIDSARIGYLKLNSLSGTRYGKTAEKLINMLKESKDEERMLLILIYRMLKENCL